MLKLPIIRHLPKNRVKVLLTFYGRGAIFVAMVLLCAVSCRVTRKPNYKYAVNFCQMKIGLELVIHEEPDGRKFLNYWDWKHGNDVCCQIIDGELFKSEYDEESNELTKKEISFAEFVKLVEAVV